MIAFLRGWTDYFVMLIFKIFFNLVEVENLDRDDSDDHAPLFLSCANTSFKSLLSFSIFGQSMVILMEVVRKIGIQIALITHFIISKGRLRRLKK